MHRKRLACVRNVVTTALLVAAVLTTTHQAVAQDSGPIIVGTREQLKSFYLTDFRLALELSYQRREDEVRDKRSPGGKTRDTEDIFRERLELATDGFIGHPNLIELDLRFGVRLEQRSIDSDTTGLRGSSDETFLDWDLRALGLKQTKLPITVYSRRSETTINRQFASSLDNELMETGVQLRLRSDTAPSFFQYFHRDQEQTSAGGVTDLDLTQDTFQWQSQLTTGEGQLLTWDYTFDRIDESGQLRRNNKFDRHDAIAIHSWDFGPFQHRSNLRSNLHFRKETGLFPLERWRWDESLRLRHTRKFETRYFWTFDQQELQESRQTLYRGSAGLRHELFESLVTNFDVGASRLEVDESDFTSDQQFALLDLEYDKIVPYGVIDATATANVSRQDDSASGGTVQIVNEPQTFNAADLIVLNRRNVEEDSIFMTDLTGVFIYAQGLDYTVRNFGDRVEIRRVAGGSIAPGQTVLLDYRIGPEPGGTTTTTGWGGSLRYGFTEGPLAGLAVYASYFQQRQDRDLDGPPDPDALPEADVDDYIYGVEYDYQNLYLKAERHHRDSTISPFEATRLEARFRSALAERSSLVFGATYDDIDRTDDEIRTSIALISGRLNWQITDRLYSTLLLIYRYEDDTTQGIVKGFEQQLDLNWRYRQTSVYLALRNSMLDSDVSDVDNRSILVGLRREF